VFGFEAWEGKASSYEALAAKVKQSGAEAVYLGGIVCAVPLLDVVDLEYLRLARKLYPIGLGYNSATTSS